MNRFSTLSIRTLLLLVFPLIPAVCHAQISPNEQLVERKVNALMQRYGIPGAAVLVYQNQQFKPFVFGVSDTASKTPVTSNTLFELGSVTKTFTTLMFAEQINAGQIKLDDTWGQFRAKNLVASPGVQSMTLLNLATHTASLPKDVPGQLYNAADTDNQRKKLDHFLQIWKPGYAPGTQAVYSNLGFSLLGMALAENQNKSLSETMQKDIFGPLKMHHTLLNLDPNSEDYRHYAQGYTSDDKPARTPAEGLLGGSWALKTSIDDMQPYLKAAVGAPETPAQILSAMKLAQTGYFDRLGAKNGSKIGLAWSIIPVAKLSTSDWNTPISGKHMEKTVRRISAPQFDGNSLIDKTGATDGFRAYIGVIPEQKVGIVILTNKFIFHSGAVRDLGRSLLVELAGISRENANSGPKRLRGRD